MSKKANSLRSENDFKSIMGTRLKDWRRLWSILCQPTGENPRSEKMQTTDGRAEVKIHLQIEEYLVIE
jgi:hypothetical protein